MLFIHFKYIPLAVNPKIMKHRFSMIYSGKSAALLNDGIKYHKIFSFNIVISISTN